MKELGGKLDKEFGMQFGGIDQDWMFSVLGRTDSFLSTSLQSNNDR